MKNLFRTILVISTVLFSSCEKEEVIYETDEQLTVTALNGRIMDCNFEPTVVSTITGSDRGYLDGPDYKALFNNPSAIAFDELREIMYVADWSNNCIRAIKNKEVTTFVGGIAGDREGVGSKARLRTPSGIAIDQHGNLFVVDRGNHKIRKITPEGKMTTFAGSTPGFVDGQGSNAKFSSPYGITIDNDGVLYVTDEGNAKIRYIKSDATVGILAGSTQGYRDSNNPNFVQFRYPRGIDIGPDGNIYVADYSNHKIRRVTRRGGRTTTFAGSRFGNRNGSLSRASFAYPSDIACDKSGNFFVVDSNNHRIRFISGNYVGNLTGSSGGNIDGDSEVARFRYPRSITIFNDDLFVADMNNHSIRKIKMAYRCN